MTDEPEHRLTHFHVGGRVGSTSLAVPAAFAQDIVLVLFDADEGCVAQAEVMGRKSYAETISVPYFIGRGEGETSFHINHDPFTSSAYELNAAFGDYYSNTGGTDYVLSEVTRPVRTVSVPSRSLDQLCLGASAELAAPDVLTLDTQASELDILRGADALLDDHVVAVIAEVQFNEVYRGGALFGDISAFLQQKGFLFAAFNDLTQYAPMRGRIGARGDGLCLFGDALFLRDPHRIASSWGENADAALQKLAFVALCHRQLEFAQLCLGLCSARAPSGGAPYLRLLDEFARACATLPKPKPWTYAEAFDVEASRARSQPVGDAELAEIQKRMEAKADAENAKLAVMAAGLGTVAALLQRHGFVFAPGIARYQERVLQAYREALSQWAPHGFTPANDRG